MPDITMCPGNECPMKTKCYRHTATPSEFRQAYFLTPPFFNDGLSLGTPTRCDHFWKNETSK